MELGGIGWGWVAAGEVAGKVIGAFVPFEAMKARENFGMKIQKKGERLKILPLPLLLLISFLFSDEFLMNPFIIRAAHIIPLYILANQAYHQHPTPRI